MPVHATLAESQRGRAAPVGHPADPSIPPEISILGTLRAPGPASQVFDP